MKRVGIKTFSGFFSLLVSACFLLYSCGQEQKAEKMLRAAKQAGEEEK